ncbi:amidohydrolase family protein [Akkermansiaceae bacterium]|nr:amidohydrolase family protein [Akkermansiaceae bacterium]MDB4388340.1 amidohydrolase family protein [Akkermansiaceae bacterium]MDB4467205.1 amidohydrolase family protein [Akkermansiaceae bacterium]
MLDTHHHLWKYTPEEFGWIPENTPLQQDQLLPELKAATSAAEVTGTIAVQARQITPESDDLLAMADHSDLIRGVVGWVPLIDDAVSAYLERLAPHPKFSGVRHVLQEEPDEYFLRDDFHRGLAQLPALGLRFDLLLFQRQLPVGIRLVDRQPELGIIVDHIAKPEAHNGRIESDWRRGMKELAKRDNVLGVKFSGLVTEFNADPEIDPDTVKAYFEESLEIFGPDRVMFGTDWPVCLLRIDSYKAWADTVRELVSQLSESEQKAILLENGERSYQLP